MCTCIVNVCIDIHTCAPLNIPRWTSALSLPMRCGRRNLTEPWHHIGCKDDCVWPAVSEPTYMVTA